MLATRNINEEFDTKGKCTQKNIPTVSAILMSLHAYTFKYLSTCPNIVTTMHCQHAHTHPVHLNTHLLELHPKY